MLNSVKVFNLVSLVLFLVCCYYMCVNSELSPPNKKDGSLTVVPQEDDSNDVEVTVEENENLDFSSEAQDVFYPTKEWKTVQPGQAIPKGLHVRLNMKTGEREAKLMDGDDGMKYKYWKLGDKQGMVNTDRKSFTAQELKKALKEFKTSKIDDMDTAERAEEIKHKYKSYEELKDDFADMNIAVKTDIEIITDLIKKLNDSKYDKEAKLVFFEDLEYYLHQIDNAQLFCDNGGMSLLMRGLNDTDSDIKQKSAFVLGSALQSNPKVQIFAIESGVMQQLIRILSIDTNKETHKKLLYALSSMLRHFPFAQKKFLELGGMSSLLTLFDNSEDISLKIKVITLLTDLYTEKTLSATGTGSSEKEKQYQQVQIGESIVERGFCSLIPGLLQAPDHDSREKVLNAMVTLKPCEETFLGYYKTTDTLYKLQLEYDKLAKEEDEDDKYFEQILKNIKSLIFMYGSKLEL